MRSAALLLALASSLFASGCGYVHFGRRPAQPKGDAALAAAYTDLAVEHKILKQELALARKEGDALRTALDRTGGRTDGGSVDLVTQLNTASRELATLRASYSKLQAERSTPAPAADALAKDLQEKLTASQRSYAELQGENTRLRGELERARTENAGLTGQLTAAAQQNERAQSALAQLNADLLAQKEARDRAEQGATALRTQLDTVLARANASAPASPPPPATPAPASLPRALQIAKAPPAESSPTAELRMDMDRLRASAPLPAAEAPARPARVHVVQAGDTLEKISRQYYGAPDRWHAIYEANQAFFSSGQPLRPGMELQIPEK